jgi:Tfp pilus assembly protein FimT
MAILAVLVSLVWPSMSRYVVQIPLQQNAQDLRATFFNIRKEAMASADPVRFRIEPKSETYVIVREAKKEAAVTKLSDTFQMKETNWSTDDPVLEALPEEWLQGNSNMRDVSSIAWTPGVTFKPDGTCDHDYEVALVHKDKKMQIKIFIRGLTGAISMSGVEIEPEEEI